MTRRNATTTPLFTQRHYVVIAKLMGENPDPFDFLGALLTFIENDNPKFDRERFTMAVFKALNERCTTNA